MNKKRTSEKRGISLIVLAITIIVIIILAVAVILSIANNNPIENAKEARFKNDVKTMQEELELLKASNYAKNNGEGYEEISIRDLKSATNYTDDFEVKDGELKIKSTASEEEKRWAKELGVKEVEAEEVPKASITFEKEGTEELEIGSEVKASNGEQFYVIGEDDKVGTISASAQDILLLAKYNLKLENDEITLKQDTSGDSNPCAFSSTAYWSNVEGIAYPDADGKYPDLNNETKYGRGSDVIAKAKAYGKDVLGAKEGRLMTYEEAKKLNTDDYSKILYGTNTEKGYLNYWLGSAYSDGSVWNVYSELHKDAFDFELFYGVRPVIKVSKSLIK